MRLPPNICKLLAVVTTAALLMCSFAVMVFAQAGDTDGDGAVDTADARVVLQSLVGGIVLTQEQLAAADIDGDGQVSTSDVRELLCDVVGNTPATSTTTPTTSTFSTSVSSTRPVTTTVSDGTTTTVPDCVSTTTLPTTTTVVSYPTTTLPDCVSTATTYPTTLPYTDPVVFTVGSVEARAGSIVEMTVYVSDTHCLVGLDFQIVYDPSVLTLQAVNDSETNPYATALHTDVFDENAQWSFTLEEDGLLNGRIVSSAETGSTAGGILFTLTFEIDVHAGSRSEVFMDVNSLLSAVGGFEYTPAYEVNAAVFKIGSASTRPPTTTTGTTDTTYPTTTTTTSTGTTNTTRPWTTTTTYPPTTTTILVLTGPDGTTQTTYPPTTTSATLPLTGTTLPAEA